MMELPATNISVGTSTYFYPPITNRTSVFNSGMNVLKMLLPAKERMQESVLFSIQASFFPRRWKSIPAFLQQDLA